MAKLDLASLINLQNETTAVNVINSNSLLTEQAMENTLSRDGTSPNQMAANLDMNSNHIINLPTPTSNYDPVRVIDAANLTGVPSVSPLPAGGTSPQILKKNSSTNYDVSWSTADTNSITNNAVTNAKLAQAAAYTLKGNATSATANLTDFTIAGLTTKTAAASTDYLLLSDTSASNALKKVAASSFIGNTFNPRAYGALGDGTTNDYAAFAACITAAVAANGTMVIDDGTYALGSTTEWGYNRFKVIALGANVVLKHTGGGTGFSFNGIGNYPATQGAIGGVFGGPNRIRLIGNASTVTLCYVNNWHWGYMKVSLGVAATTYMLRLQDTGIVTASAVESVFDVQISPNIDGAANFTTIPQFGINADRAVACSFPNLTVEGCGTGTSYGVTLTRCTSNTFDTGTIESNAHGGVSLDGTSNHNAFIRFSNETNGDQKDWLVAGNYNTFIACGGTGTTGGQTISGTNNIFLNCTLQSATNSGNYNGYENCEFLTAFTESSNTARIVNPSGFATAADNYPHTFGNKTISTGGNNVLIVNGVTLTNAIGGLANANALTIGPNATTNPTLQIDTSTASAATGIKVKSAAAAGGLAITTLSSGTDENLTIDAKGAGTITLNGTATGGVAIGRNTTITSSSSNALVVGRQGATNPVLQIDASTGSVATGIKIKGAAAAGGVAVSVITSGTNENLTLDAAGSGTINIGGTSTGAITLSRAVNASVTLTMANGSSNGIFFNTSGGSADAQIYEGAGGAFALKFGTNNTWNVTLNNNTSVLDYAVTTAGTLTSTPAFNTIAETTIRSTTATPAGGSTSARLLFGTTAGFGIYYGSGAPTVSAGTGSLYIRTDNAGASLRLYSNTGTTNWVAITSA